MLGYFVAWLLGCLVTCLHGYLVLDCLVTWLFGCLVDHLLVFVVS